MARPTRCHSIRVPALPTETGVGNIFNAPLRAGDGGVEFRDAMERVILPALSTFSPDLVIVSAGFDAHERDPLGSLRLTEEDFAWITLRLMDVADEFIAGAALFRCWKAAMICRDLRVPWVFMCTRCMHGDQGLLEENEVSEEDED